MFADGGVVLSGVEPYQPEPCGYYTPGFHPPIAGADWFIDGRRFRETGRGENYAMLTLCPEES
ncbi:hypothetical protein [Nocardia sp. NPDC057440]|uniref:hypothetical protein n=1 Tax=Nocardia sp. NPDC057440 TaxID=3346134 RepID=UPI003672A906